MRNGNSLACPETTETHPANADQRRHAFNAILRLDDKLCDDTDDNRGDTWSAVHQQDGMQTQKRTVMRRETREAVYVCKIRRAKGVEWIRLAMQRKRAKKVNKFFLELDMRKVTHYGRKECGCLRSVGKRA